MIEDLFAKLAPVIGEEKMDRLWLLYQTETNLDRRRELEGIIHSLASKHLNENYQKNKILLPPPATTTDEGFLMGTIYYGEEPRQQFVLSEQELLFHCGVFGSTGSGKTNLGFLLIKQFIEKGLPFFIFDWKRNYRDILATDWAGRQSITIYTVGRDIVPFSFDALAAPPGTDNEIWENRVLDILSHSHFLGHGVRYLLRNTLNTTEDHSFGGLYNSLAKLRAIGRRRQWLDSAIRAVGDLTLGNIGQVFSNDKNISLAAIFNKYIVFELDALPDDAKTFFIETILAWLHQYRLNQPSREVAKHAIVIEEAHHVLLKRKDYHVEQESTMDIIFREIRELGEALIIFDQHPSLISKPALGNTGTTLLMRLKHADDVRAGADAVLLKMNERDYLGQLQTGWAIVKTPNITKPFLIKIPHVAIPKGTISDEALRQRIRGYSHADDVILPPDTTKPDIRPLPEEDKGELNNKEHLTEPELAFMKDILAYPTAAIVERYTRLNLSAHTGNRTKEYLRERQLIQEFSIPNGKGAIKVLQITGDGSALLLAAGVDIRGLNFSQRLGGPEHRYWVNRIADELKDRGCNVQKEYATGDGHFIDIVAEKNGKKIGIEVETGKSNVAHNIHKSDGSDIQTVIVIATSEKERKRILDQCFGQTLSSTSA